MFTSVNQRQRTTHESADRQHSERVSAVLLIRKSSVRARRGPPHICAGQKLKILLRAPTEPSRRRAKWHFLAHRVLESAGRRSRPWSQAGVCAGQRLRVRLVIFRNRADEAALWHICGTSRTDRRHVLCAPAQFSWGRMGWLSPSHHRDRALPPSTRGQGQQHQRRVRSYEWPSPTGCDAMGRRVPSRTGRAHGATERQR